MARAARFTDLITPSLLAIWAVITELCGRQFFPNWDVSYALYGARFYMDRGSPWMNVWPGMDILLGNLSAVLRQPEAAITLVGALLNVIATLVVWEIFKRQGVNATISLLAALVTALWFKPPLGGWVGDHLSYMVAVSPALGFALARGRWTRWLDVLTGSAIALTATLKLNSGIPGLVFSGIWIMTASALIRTKDPDKQKAPRKLLKKIGQHLALAGLAAAVAAIAIQVASGLSEGLYNTVFKTYSVVLQSQASNQTAFSKLLLLPLQIDPIEAIAQRQTGVLLFLPIVAAFWACVGCSAWKIHASGTSRLRHATALFLLLSSALVAFSLGRGLTHRLFFLPAGLLLSASDLPISSQNRKQLACLLTAWLCATWLSFAWVQRSFEFGRLYNSRQLIENQEPRLLCIGSEPKNSDQSLVIHARPLSGARMVDKRCWNPIELRQQMAGVVDVQELANTLGFTFKNQQEGKGDFREKWDWRQATPTGRKQWVREQAGIINQLQMPYLVERISLTEEERGVPGYDAWREPRQQQQLDLAKATGSTAIARIGALTIWRTKWAK